jgi:hypothetical protein
MCGIRWRLALLISKQLACFETYRNPASIRPFQKKGCDMASDSETDSSIALGWVILIIAAGFALLGYSSRLEEHNFFKPIVESLGDGLFLLGFIDLLVRKSVFSWLTRPPDYWKLAEEWLEDSKKTMKKLDEATRTLADFNRDARLERIEEKSDKTVDGVDEILKRVRLLTR